MDNLASAAAAADLSERSRRAVWHPCTQMQRLRAEPVTPIVGAEGPWLYGAGGERWFDGISSWWTCLLGHRQPEVVAALHQQLDTLDHVMLAGFTHEPAVLLAETLSTRTGGRLGHLSLASDGASALEIALKQSAHAWRNQGLPGKNQFVCLSGSYHGETLGALGVTDNPLFSANYQSLMRAGRIVQGPDDRVARRSGRTPVEEAHLAAERLEAVLAEHADCIASVVLEPLMQGAGGMVMYHPEFLKRVRALCDRYGVHWIADEIATGCGRTGTFFAVEQAGVWPDLLCLSKGLSGGMLPLSVVLSSEAVFAAFLDAGVERAFLHSHSFTGNPLACRAAVATLAVLDAQQVLAGNVERAARIGAGLATLAGRPGVEDFRQLGMIWAFELSGGSVQARRVQAEARARGLLVRPLGHTVYLMPPFLLTPELCDWLGRTLVEAVDAGLSSPDTGTVKDFASVQDHGVSGAALP